MIFLQQSAARTLALGPFVDDVTGKDAETGLTITVADVLISKNGAAFAAKNDATDPAHMANGFYSVVLNATDTATLGHLVISIHESGALPVWIHCLVCTQNAYDSHTGQDRYDVNVVQINGDATAAINLDADYDGTGYAKANSTIGTATDLTNPNPTQADLVDAVWDEDIVAAHNGADTAGALLDDLATPANFKADVTPLATPSNFMADVAALATSAEVGALENASLDDIADAVWDEDIVAAHNTGDTAGALLDDLGTPANFMANIAGLNDPTAEDVADAVWDETIADHDGVGSTGEALAGATAPSAATVADAVWNEDVVTEHNDANSAGALLDDLGTPANFKADVTPLATPSNFMADVAALATSAEVGALENASLDDIADAVWDEDIVAAHNTGDTAGALLDDLGTPANFMANVSALATSAEVGALENASLDDIADAVWDEDIVLAHNTADTPGALLDDLGTPANFMANVAALATSAEVGALENASLDDIADAVWDETIADHDGAGSTGLALAGASAPSAADVADAVWLETIDDHSGSGGSTAEALAGASAPSAADVADAVWDEDITEHVGVDSAGEALGAAGSGADADAIADAVWDEDIVAAHNGADTAGALLDDLGTPASFMANVAALATSAEIAALEDASLDDIADAVWDEDIVAAHNTGDTAGSLLDDVGTPSDFKANVAALATSAEVGALENASLDDIADAVWDEDIVAAHNTADTAGTLLDDLGTPSDFKANVTPLDTPSNFMANVSALATSAEVGALENAAIDDIADAVWDEAIGDHDGVGSTGLALAGATAPSAGDVADAVWDEDIVTAHNTGDTAGALLDDLATPANFMADVTPLATPSNFMANVSALATSAEVGALENASLDDIADAVWDEAIGDHDGAGSTGLALAGATAPSAADVADAVWDEDIVAAHNTGDTAGALLDDLATPANFKANVSALATSAEIAALNDPTAGAIADAVWDEDIVAGHNTGDTAGALLDDLGTPASFKADVSALATAAAVSALNDPSAADVADAVWDEATADHQDTGTTGKALTTSGAGSGATAFVYTLTSTADDSPVADADVWVTSDIGGDVTVASGRTNAQGKVTFYLDSGTYYFWRQKTGWNFTNPDTEAVS